MIDDTALARSFKALAHPRRARIFRLLAEQPELGQSIDRLGQATGFAETSLAHHLAVMRRCGLLHRHRQGAQVRHAIVGAELLPALATATALGRRAAALPPAALPVPGAAIGF